MTQAYEEKRKCPAKNKKGCIVDRYDSDDNSSLTTSKEDLAANSMPWQNKSMLNMPHHPARKPNISYSNLIIEAITSSPEKKLALKDIYEYVIAKYPFFQHRKGNWQNSIRHNLSLNKCFYKIPRNPLSAGKGAYWAIDKNGLTEMITQKSKKPRKFSKNIDYSAIVSVMPPSDSLIHAISPLANEEVPMTVKNILSESAHFNGDLFNPDFYFDKSSDKNHFFTEESFGSGDIFKFK